MQPSSSVTFRRGGKGVGGVSALAFLPLHARAASNTCYRASLLLGPLYREVSGQLLHATPHKRQNSLPPPLWQSMCATQDFRPVPVAIDHQGIVPSALRALLDGMVAAGQQTPRLLHTVPVGQNPTGGLPILRGGGGFFRVGCTNLRSKTQPGSTFKILCAQPVSCHP